MERAHRDQATFLVEGRWACLQEASGRPALARHGWWLGCPRAPVCICILITSVILDKLIPILHVNFVQPSPVGCILLLSTILLCVYTRENPV